MSVNSDDALINVSNRLTVPTAASNELSIFQFAQLEKQQSSLSTDYRRPNQEKSSEGPGHPSTGAR